MVWINADVFLRQMTKSRRASREEESRPVSDDDSEESEDKAASEGRQSTQLPATSQRG